jgi:hypothetical protein
MRVLVVSILFALSPLACSGGDALNDASAQDAGAGDVGSGGDTGPSDAGADARLDANPSDVDPGRDIDPGMDLESTDMGPLLGEVTIIFEPAQFSNDSLSGFAFINRPDGTLVRTSATTTGMIVETIEDGWTVSFASTDEGGLTGLSSLGPITTVVGVSPGETYRVANYDFSLSATMDVNIGGGYVGAAHYEACGPCMGLSFNDPPQPAAIPMELSAACVGTATTVGLLVIASDANRNPIAWRGLKGVALAQGGLLEATDPWRTNFDVSNVSVTNLLPGTEVFTARVANTIDHLGYCSVVLHPLISSGTGTASISRPAFGDGLDWTFMGEQSFDEHTDLRTWISFGETPPSDWTHDMSADFLPYPGPITALSGADGFPISFAWSPPKRLTMQVLTLGSTFSWSILLQGSASAFAVPELPPDLHALLEGEEFHSSLYQMNANWLSGYADAKAQFGSSTVYWKDALSRHKLNRGDMTLGAELYYDPF